MTKSNHSETRVHRLISSMSDTTAPAVRVGDMTVSVVRMGPWVFTPASARLAREANATLHDKDRCVDLQYSSSIVEDFLTAMASIETDFATLSTSALSERHDNERTGQSFHA